jgi:hypothetical protein
MRMMNLNLTQKLRKSLAGRLLNEGLGFKLKHTR